MTADQLQLQLLIGGAVGLVSAIIAGFYQYRIARNGNETRTRGLPGCLMLVAGWLGLVGLLVAAVSLAFTGKLTLAVVSGLGVLAGFFAGSASMFILLLRTHPDRSRKSRR